MSSRVQIHRNAVRVYSVKHEVGKSFKCSSSVSQEQVTRHFAGEMIGLASFAVQVQIKNFYHPMTFLLLLWKRNWPISVLGKIVQ